MNAKTLTPDEEIDRQLSATCEAVVSELNRIGTLPAITCKECKNLKPAHLLKTDETPDGYYCDARSSPEDFHFFAVHASDDISRHGSGCLDDFNLCDDFNAVGGDSCQLAFWDECVEYKNKKYYSSMYNWITDQFDTEYVIGSSGEYKHGTIITCVGGPDVHINTDTKTVNGYWGSDHTVTLSLDDEIIYDLDENLEIFFNDLKKGR